MVTCNVIPVEVHMTVRCFINKVEEKSINVHLFLFLFVCLFVLFYVCLKKNKLLYLFDFVDTGLNKPYMVYQSLCLQNQTS